MTLSSRFLVLTVRNSFLAPIARDFTWRLANLAIMGLGAGWRREPSQFAWLLLLSAASDSAWSADCSGAVGGLTDAWGFPILWETSMSSKVTGGSTSMTLLNSVRSFSSVLPPVVSGMPNTLMDGLRLYCSSSSIRSCVREFSYFNCTIMASRDFRSACNLTTVFCSSWMASLVCSFAARIIFFRIVWTSGSLRAMIIAELFHNWF